MSKGSANRSRLQLALLLGLAATIAAGALYLCGLDGRLESLSLDWRFRYLTTAPAAQRIVHVDIDDSSLNDFGRWPWPREQIAGMIDVLNECGARAVVLDIIMPEPQNVRYESDTRGATLGELASPEPILDDRILAQSIRRGQNVLLPMYVKLMDAAPPSPLEADLEKRVGDDPNLSAGDADALDDVRRPAYFRAQAMNALRRFARPLTSAQGYPLQTGSITPPFFTLARAMRQTGFVTFVPESDGTIRRIPLLVRHNNLVFPQFAMAVAADDLRGDGGGSVDISATASAVTLRCPDGSERVIPIDANGCMLINWMKKEDEGDSSRHLPAKSLVRHWRWKHEMETSLDQRALQCQDLLELGKSAQAEKLTTLWMDLCEQRGRLHKQFLADQVMAYCQALQEPGAPAPDLAPQQAQEKKVQERIARFDEDLVGELRDPNKLDLFLSVPAGASAADQTQKDLDAARIKARMILDQYDRLLAADRERKQSIEADLNVVRARVAGKICLIGSTATGAADFVPTPMNERMPGVQVHANIVNTILGGAFVRRAGTATDLAAILVAGLVVTLLAGRLSAVYAGPGALLAAAGFVAFNALVMFHHSGVWLAMVAPLIAMALSFLIVTAYRQLTEERAKRQIRGILAQTLSPALVDRVVEDPSLLKLGGEQRELSCFFSDLAGFTPLSKRLGEQETIRLINRYFDRMTEVIQARRGGYLSKFMGDGIFVFFGAPVFQDDHPARAVRAAVECQQALADFNRELAAEPNNVRLVCRIGISTGPAMVGNCGSSDRIDYTAIGDTVNLASRLEGANKFFGTLILVEEETWLRAALADVVARPMGKIFVVGRDEPVAVWNVLGGRDQVAPAARQAAAQWPRAIELFAARNFTAAAEIFEPLCLADGADKAASVYLSLCRQYAQSPPGDPWDGAIRLTEK